MSSTSFGIAGISLIGHNLSGWSHCRQWLAQGRFPGPPAPLNSQLLSARERRRAPLTVRQALAVAEDACRMAGKTPGELPGVFASAMGDLDITHYMCAVLADTPEHLSPTRFHNSVHNAAAGYWSIGAGARADISALCGYTDSFAAGLLEAVTRCTLEQTPILFVCYDVPATGLLEEVWTAQHAFAGALVLTPPGQAGSSLQLETTTTSQSLPALPAELDAVARDNPAARLLYLLALTAGHANEMTLAPQHGPAIKLSVT